MTKKIIFRADGNVTTGLGHFYRLFSLVEIIKDTLEFVFLTRESSLTSVIPESYKKAIIPKTISVEYEPQWLASNFSSKEYIIIADGYQFGTSYQEKVKILGYNLMYIDDLAKEHMYADIVINHSPNIKESHYSKEEDTILALGTKYALLRPSFLKEAKKNRIIKTIDSAFVCFGGSDPFNLTFYAVKALLKNKLFNNIHVVLGGAYGHLKIFDLEKRNSDKIITYQNISEEKLIQVMRQSNFAIVPASTILYELCCVKMPVLSGFYVDNQELIYKGFLENKAIYEGEDMKSYREADFIEKIETVLKENKFSNKVEAQKALFDDKVESRHLNLIIGLC